MGSPGLENEEIRQIAKVKLSKVPLTHVPLLTESWGSRWEPLVVSLDGGPLPLEKAALGLGVVVLRPSVPGPGGVVGSPLVVRNLVVVPDCDARL